MLSRDVEGSHKGGGGIFSESYEAAEFTGNLETRAAIPDEGVQKTRYKHGPPAALSAHPS